MKEERNCAKIIIHFLSLSLHLLKKNFLVVERDLCAPVQLNPQYRDEKIEVR